jgi:hypothetical protein
MPLKKSIWIINEYGSTPEVSGSGRSYYFATHLVKRGYDVTLLANGTNHLIRNPNKIEKSIFTKQ